MPVTLQVYTGGDGDHFYFNYNNLLGISKKFGPGIDIKNNGYVVAPPSIHESGKEYMWVTDQGPGEIPIADVPGYLQTQKIEYVPKDGDPQGSSREHLKKLSGISELKGEVFDFIKNSNDTHQIVVNGELSGCWVDSNGLIGSHDKGGPTIIQWICWYGAHYSTSS